MKTLPLFSLVLTLTHLFASAAPGSDSSHWCVLNFETLEKTTLGREVYQEFFASEVAALVRQRLPDRFHFLEQAQLKKIRIESFTEDVSIVIVQAKIDRAAALAVLSNLSDYVQLSYEGHVVHHFRCDPKASFESLVSETPDPAATESQFDDASASENPADAGVAQEGDSGKDDAVYLCELPEDQWVLANDLSHLAATVKRVIAERMLTDLPANLVMSGRFPLQVPGTTTTAKLSVTVAEDGRITARLRGDCDSDAARSAVLGIKTLIFDSPQLEGMLTQWFEHLQKQQEDEKSSQEGLEQVEHGRFSIGFARINASRLDEPVAETDLSEVVRQLAAEIRELLQFKMEDSSFEFSVSAYVGAKSSRFDVNRGKCDIGLEFSVFTSLEEMTVLTAKAAEEGVQR